MAENWEKRGRIHVPDGTGFFKSHAARPIPFRLDQDTIRVLFSSRDDDDRMLPTFVDVAIDDPGRVLRLQEEPLMDLGKPGTFDDSGVTPGCVVRHGDEWLVYYTGWKRRRVNVSFELAIGLCRMVGLEGRLERVFDGPLIGQDRHHPYLVGGPFVLPEGGGFRMWYCSGSGWTSRDGNPEPLYRVHHAASQDGIDWAPRAEPVVDYRFDGEVISAPWVVARGGRYEMWYSTRGSATAEAKRYCIGYAESVDGLRWTRKDEEAGIARSETGWDSEMICYPGLFRHGDREYMFYSGNAVGRGGLGYAVRRAPAG